MKWIAMVLMIVAAPALAGPEEDLQQLFDDEWQNQLRESPLFATSVGVHDYNDRLPSVALNDQLRREKQTQQFLERLQAIDRNALSTESQLNYDIFERTLKDQIGEAKYKRYLLPITNRGGFHVSFPQLPDWVPLKTVEDYENYCARLEAFNNYAAQHIELMYAGIKSGHVLPRVVLEGYESAIEPHIVDDPTESLLYKPFESFPDEFSAADCERLTERGRAAIETSVVPGYRAFARFMKDDYLPAASESIGARDLPDGRAFYEHRVRRFTTLPLTPGEVHETGKAEVARIRAEMQEVIDGTGFEGTFAEFVQFLRTDKQFYVDTPEQLMKETAYVLKKMDGELPGLFGDIAADAVRHQAHSRLHRAENHHGILQPSIGGWAARGFLLRELLRSPEPPDVRDRSAVTPRSGSRSPLADCAHAGAGRRPRFSSLRRLYCVC